MKFTNCRFRYGQEGVDANVEFDEDRDSDEEEDKDVDIDEI